MNRILCISHILSYFVFLSASFAAMAAESDNPLKPPHATCDLEKPLGNDALKSCIIDFAWKNELEKARREVLQTYSAWNKNFPSYEARLEFMKAIKNLYNCGGKTYALAELLALLPEAAENDSQIENIFLVIQNIFKKQSKHCPRLDAAIFCWKCFFSHIKTMEQDSEYLATVRTKYILYLDKYFLAHPQLHEFNEINDYINEIFMATNNKEMVDERIKKIETEDATIAAKLINEFIKTYVQHKKCSGGITESDKIYIKKSIKTISSQQEQIELRDWLINNLI